MSDNTLRLKFGPPKYVMRCLKVPRARGIVSIGIPLGGQITELIAPEHEPESLHFWCLMSVENREIRFTRFLIVDADTPFDVEECSSVVELEDGTVMEEVHIHVNPVGSWTEKVVNEDGSVDYRTAHVLEILEEDHDEVDEDDLPNE